MKRSTFSALILFFTLLYTKGLWCRVGVPALAVEGVLFVLPLVVLLSEHGALGKPAPGFLFVWFYLGWSLAACIYNGEGVLRGLLYARFLVVAYIVFWVVWETNFTARQLFSLNRVILGLFLLQVLAALFEWLVLGEKTEAIVGTMGIEGGSLATSFPMLAFSCWLAFFLYYNRPIYLIAGLSFFVVGHASNKLAIFCFIPVLLILGLVLYGAAEGLSNALRRSLPVGLVVLSGAPVVLYLLSHTHRAERLQEETRARDKIMSFWDLSRAGALEEQSWYTTTRGGTSLRVLEETFRRSPSTFLFGRGTQAFLDGGKPAGEGVDEYGIIYGIVGWSKDALAVGWPAMFAHVGFYVFLFHRLLSSRRARRLGTYWKAIFLAVQLGFLVFLIVYFQYSTDFTVVGGLSHVYLFFLAVLLAPQYRDVLQIDPGGPLVPARGVARSTFARWEGGGNHVDREDRTRPGAVL